MPKAPCALLQLCEGKPTKKVNNKGLNISLKFSITLWSSFFFFTLSHNCMNTVMVVVMYSNDTVSHQVQHIHNKHIYKHTYKTEELAILRQCLTFIILLCLFITVNYNTFNSNRHKHTTFSTFHYVLRRTNNNHLLKCSVDTYTQSHQHRPHSVHPI